jgi:peptidoglycan/LPS O-acetylase OafA/YrhL
MIVTSIAGWGIESVPTFRDETSRAWWYIFFVGNFDMAYNSYISPVIGVLWSIAVEEQFYIVWPLLLTAVLAVFKKRSTFVVIVGLLAIIIYSLIYRYTHVDNNFIVKYATQSVVSDLALGALIATLIKKYNWDLLGQYVTKKMSIVVYILLVLFVLTRNLIDSTTGDFGAMYESFEPLIFSLFAAYIIFEQNYAKSSIFKLSNIPHANYLGKISYGLYAYHMILLFAVSTLAQKVFIGFGFGYLFTQISVISIALYIALAIIGLALTVWFANISYVHIERKILAFKDRVASSH